jgi:copper chaperone CopZ
MPAKKDDTQPAPVSQSLMACLGDKNAFMQRIKQMSAKNPPKEPESPIVHMSEHAKQCAAEIKAEIKKVSGKVEAAHSAKKLNYCPMPTELCRVSPFFVMSRTEMAHRPFLDDELIVENAWGDLKYTGKKLSIYEEDALVALIAVIDQKKDKNEYCYTGPGLPILKMMGYDRPRSSEYGRLESSFKMMAGAVFHLRIKGVVRTTENIITKISVDEKTRIFTIVINPYFYEMYVAGSVTLLDVVERRRLKKSTAKSMFRFLQSHHGGKWSGKIETLAKTLNLSMQMREVRRLIKEAIIELKATGYLDKKSCVSVADVVNLSRRVELVAEK